MAIIIQLTPDREAALTEEAARRGVAPAEYARQLVEDGMRPSRPLAEILAPFREQVKVSGLSDAELDDLVEDAREQVYRERQARGA